MLKIVLTALDPSVVVGVELLRSKLENMKLAPFKNNVNDMCTEIEDLVHRIEGLGQKCELIQPYTLNALTSGPNDRFNKYIEHIADDINSGTGANKDLDWESIISANFSTGNLDFSITQ